MVTLILPSYVFDRMKYFSLLRLATIYLIVTLILARDKTPLFELSTLHFPLVIGLAINTLYHFSHQNVETNYCIFESRSWFVRIPSLITRPRHQLPEDGDLSP